MEQGYKVDYINNRPSYPLFPYYRLDASNYGYNSNPTHMRHFPYFKDIVKQGTDLKGNKIRIVRRETDEELRDLIIDPKHFFEKTNLSNRVVLTPRRLGADPGSAISAYLQSPNTRNSNDYRVQMTKGISRDRRYFKCLKNRQNYCC